jgi:hypothetical protein
MKKEKILGFWLSSLRLFAALFGSYLRRGSEIVTLELATTSPYLFSHPSIYHGVTTFDTFGPSFDALVSALCNYQLDLSLLALRIAFPHELLDLLSFFPFRHVRCCVHAFSLLHSLFKALGGSQFLPTLGFCDFLDWARIKCSLTRPQGSNGLLRNRDIGLVMLCLIVEEPGREVILGVKRIAIEPIIQKVRFGCSAIDQLLCESDSFGGRQTIFYGRDQSWITWKFKPLLWM